jgi:hypothetical protein
MKSNQITAIILSVTAALALVACDKPTVVNTPASPPSQVVVPVPLPGPTGPAGPSGDAGTKEKKDGNTTVKP